MRKLLSAAMAAVVVGLAVLVPSSGLRGRWADVVWEIADGVLTVSGADIPDCTASSAAPWMKFAGRVTAIAVGDGVSRIGDRAFEDMTSAKSVDLGEAVSIGDMAFSGCSVLASADVPSGVTEIGDFAFAECSGLRSVSLPSTLGSIGEGIFEACHSLRTIDCQPGRYYSSDGVLMDGSASAILRYPPKRSGTEYTAPAGVWIVEPGAFRDAAGLQSVSLPGVMSVGAGAFYGCTALENVSVPAVSEIGQAAFYGCDSLKEISFGDSLTDLGGSAFAYCTSLGIADFAGNAPAAGDQVFLGCHSSFTVMIGENSTGFGDGGMWLGYPVMRHGNYGGEADGIAWSIDSRTGVMTVAGMGAVPDYEYASDAPWYEYRRIIRSLELQGITAIGNNSFRYSALRELYLPASVTAVGDWAFSGCAYLETAAIAGHTAIGECAFYGDTALVEVRIPAAAEIGRQAFSGCENLEYVIAGKTAPELGEYAFDGTDASVVYPPGGSGYSGGNWDGVHTEAFFPGDANGDGRCNISDVSHLMKHIAGWDGISLQRVSADTNGDGRTNITDASNMMKHIAGWDIGIFEIEWGIPAQ